MAKKQNITNVVKLQIPAGNANPAPPVGPALGQAGINISDFCRQFNEKTGGFEKGLPIPAVISVYKDRSFTFEIKSPPASVLLRKAAKIAKGSPTPNTLKVGKVTRKQLEEIVAMKQLDLSAINMDNAVRTLAGTARSMGIEVE